MSYSETKAERQRAHARRRAEQRYKIRFTHKLRREAVQQIQSGKAEFVCKHTCRVSRWRVKIEGRLCLVLYDNKRKLLITFLHDHEKEQS